MTRLADCQLLELLKREIDAARSRAVLAVKP